MVWSYGGTIIIRLWSNKRIITGESGLLTWVSERANTRYDKWRDERVWESTTDHETVRKKYGNVREFTREYERLRERMREYESVRETTREYGRVKERERENTIEYDSWRIFIQRINAIIPSPHVDYFLPSVYIGNFSSVTEMNKAWIFKFQSR